MWLVGSEGSGEVVGRSHCNTRGATLCILVDTF